MLRLRKSTNKTRKMVSLSREELMFFVQNYFDMIMVALFSIGVTYFASKAWKRIAREKEGIPGRLGIPFVGETFSFLSATKSTKGCYEFVRLRRLW